MKHRTTVVAIVAHPDDAEIWAGGTLLSYVYKGYRVEVVYPLGVSSIRRQEAYRSVFSCSFTRNLRHTLVTLRPEIILTHWHSDTHFEHRRVYEEVNCIIPEMVVTEKITPRLFAFGTYNNLGVEDNFMPDDFVDISDYWSEKVKLISNFASQNPDMWINMIECVNSLWGRQVGVRFAEGFKEIPVLGVKRRSLNILCK